MKNFKTGTLIAITAGSLFVSACKKDGSTNAAEPVQPAAAEEAGDMPEATPAAAETGDGEKTSLVDCAGVNACKGQGTCKTATHGCGGQNACKGQGVVAMTEEECKAKGGTVSNH